MVLMSTAYELSRWQSTRKKSSELPLREQLFRSFGAISNIRTIFWSGRPNDKFGLLDGLRTILSFWVLLSHEHILAVLPFNSKRVEASTAWGIIMSKSYTHMKNINLIDTFFFIGGNTRRLEFVRN